MLAVFPASLQVLPVVVQLLQTHDPVLKTRPATATAMRLVPAHRANISGAIFGCPFPVDYFVWCCADKPAVSECGLQGAVLAQSYPMCRSDSAELPYL